MNVYLCFFNTGNSLNDLADGVLYLTRNVYYIAAVAYKNDNVNLNGVINYLNGDAETKELAALAALYTPEELLCHLRLLDDALSQMQRSGSTKRTIAEMTSSDIFMLPFSALQLM